VPEDAIAKEREMIAAQARNEGKPDAIIEKIVEGRIGSFYADYVLYDQVFVNPERFDGTVGAMIQDMVAKLGENIEVARFSRVAVGEEPE
jgi:elongation factor Ts